MEFESVPKVPGSESDDEEPDRAEECEDDRIAPISSIVRIRERAILILQMGEQPSVGKDAAQEPYRNSNPYKH